MGHWVRAVPASLQAGVAAALLSCVATWVQLAAVIDMTDHRAFLASLAPIGAAVAMALSLGGFYMARAWRQPSSAAPEISQSFSIMLALGFAVIVSVMLIAISALRAWFGEIGLISAAAIGGALDLHAASIAVAAQVASGEISAAQAVVPILVASVSSTVAKILFSAAVGGRAFSLRVIPGLVLIVAAAWAGYGLVAA